MTNARISPFGSWRSPISPELAAGAISEPEDVFISDGVVYWVERRPQEAGRLALMRKPASGESGAATPSDFNCRTRVHEYGGGAYLADGEIAFASEFEDQRLYRLEAGSEPFPITPEPEIPAGLRYADGRLTGDQRSIICVQERHQAQDPAVNEIVMLPTDGSREPRVLASGRDFYAFPRPSPDGDKLAWIEWDQPNMPWDGTELWLAELSAGGELSNTQKIAGGASESIFQPAWSPDGTLHYVSDRSGWWNLHRVDQSDPILARSAEFGSPMWSFGKSQYCFLSDGRILSIYTENGTDQLALISAEGFVPLEMEFSSFYPRCLRFDPTLDRAVFIAASPTQHSRVYEMDIDTGEVQPLGEAPGYVPDASYISIPRPIRFPAGDGLEAHALYYPPANRDYSAPEGERPPLLVISHGGPTSSARSELNLPRQFFTSRGFAIVDVNYRGSTGYGRQYRQLLNGAWGVADVEDCIHAAKYLIEQGEVDPQRVAVRGGSAGGYTTLCALVFHDFFTAGASYYGVADAEALAKDTHKFEARYLDSMIGPYPEAIELYRERSPIHFVDQLSAPLIVLQGGEDRVVPQAQAEMMVEALEAKGLPYAYLLFEREAHGFRAAENIQRSIEAELYFYGKIFGFELGEPVQPIEIRNLDA
jgi:dipeptidyl aminopeptidase/acylaminoacyl peptidase